MQAKYIQPPYLDIVFDHKILYNKNDFMRSVFDGLKGELEEYCAERRWIRIKWVVSSKKYCRYGK
ncbi:MAG: hypothetical protein ACP5K8_04380 [Nitrososphaeria archaeon]